MTDGWGTADTGGSWTGTTADHDVGSGIGTIAIGAGVGRDANLTAVSARDVEFLMRVRVNRTVTGGDVYAAAQLRRQDSSNFYQARLTYSPTGVLKISARKTAAGTPTVLGSEYTTLAPTTSDWYWFRGQVSGTPRRSASSCASGRTARPSPATGASKRPMAARQPDCRAPATSASTSTRAARIRARPRSPAASTTWP